MSNKASVRKHRERQRRLGIVRLEVYVPRGDAALVRSISEALLDPDFEGQTRRGLLKLLPPPKDDLKAVLTAAPAAFDALDLRRPRAHGRAVKP